MKRLIFSVFILLITCAVSAEITHGPYLQAVTETTATIVWTTDKPAVSWVELAPAGDDSFYAEERPPYYQTRDGNRVIGTLHKITLTGLKKGTAYRYRIFSREVLEYHGQHNVLYGQVSASAVYDRSPLKFKTLDESKDKISFKILNDIHGRVDDLKALCSDVGYGKTDMVVFNGDMMTFMVSETDFFNGFMDDAVKMYAGEVPVFYVRGNHETRGPFNTSFSDYFPTRNPGKLYYSFRQGPVHFIMLDSGEDKPDSDIEYSGLAQFDAYRSEQCEWLKAEIQSESFRIAPYRVVVIHIPPLASDWHGTNEVRKKFLPILNKAGITAMFCGHLHAYVYDEPNAQHDFPILINAHRTALDVQADAQKMTVKQLDTAGKELHTFTWQPVKK